jgi:hypothetical protein
MIGLDMVKLTSISRDVSPYQKCAKIEFHALFSLKKEEDELFKNMYQTGFVRCSN